jgi:hypothetical protein
VASRLDIELFSGFEPSAPARNTAILFTPCCDRLKVGGPCHTLGPAQQTLARYLNSFCCAEKVI